MQVIQLWYKLLQPVYHTWITKCLHSSNFFFLKDDLNLNKIINITVESLLLGTSIQGIPPFRGHKIWSWKNVSHIIFISVTFTEGTPFLRGKGHFFCNRRQNCCRMISENKRIYTPPPPLHSKLGFLLFSTGSMNSGTTLHGEDGGGQGLVSKTSKTPFQ